MFYQRYCSVQRRNSSSLLLPPCRSKSYRQIDGTETSQDGLESYMTKRIKRHLYTFNCFISTSASFGGLRPDGGKYETKSSSL